ncbi:MAG: HNH endonuclease signature motif containing protein [Candidatus Pacebacteria bacterium]|nr:HNH endonuclease signature motif containing protein [Candidatus Paceibacterota bacterium]MDD3072205.1 HNH endonuclease signature motif containing protein [Candidatus Paceibacterota bacterium]MDD4201162.1 HNH endonuclease signature motif containing protein [Candidatus Paceibacterota bacterium]MDD4467452.1 HNH endonuclease signature motif containing protein [Candidatus Paceibacterota bacterium]MDD4897749.1 HNH endonuclease signature motif containing protein [Candidatus Paceibacterota bacterium
MEINYWEMSKIFLSTMWLLWPVWLSVLALIILRVSLYLLFKKLGKKRLRKEGQRVGIPRDIQEQVYDNYKGRCFCCGDRKNLEFDHIIPVSKGGSSTIKNLQLLCQKCNRKKSSGF